MGKTTSRGFYRPHPRAGVSVLALAIGMAAAGMEPAHAAPCGSGSGQTISAPCTGPFTWNGDSLANSSAISGGSSGIEVDADATTLTNTGTIDGSTSGIVNSSSTVESLVNNGTITGQAGHGIDIATVGSARFGTISNGALGTIGGSQSGLYFETYSTGADLIDNAGTISGTDAGITVASGLATVSAITNSGTITGNVGINNASTITALTNSGRIEGTTAAIDNSGTIGAIVNSGVISGNIINGSSNTLTINGSATTGAYGSLTGGTISSTGANVVFGSGNILLEDDVNVSGHILSNTGATIKLTSAAIPTVTGTYSQSGGGLALSVSSSSSYGYLDVTGDATVANATITLNGTSMQAGETYRVVRSGGIGSYNANTVLLSGRGGLTASLGASGDDLVVTLDAKDYTTIGGSNPISNALTMIATKTDAAASAFQSDVLAALDGLPTARQASAIRQLTPTQTIPAAQMGQSAANAVLGAVEQHQQTAMAYEPIIGKAAGSDVHDASVWGQFLGGGAMRNGNADASGYKTRDFGVAFGLDNRFDSKFMAGLAFSWIRALSQGTDDAAGSSTILDNFQLTQYGTLRDGRAFMDWQLAAGWNHFDQKRAIGFLGRTAQADFEGRQYLARVKFGYDFSVMDTMDTTLTPLAGVAWSRSITAAYTEQGAGSANLSVDRRGINAVSHTLGFKVTGNMQAAWGLLKPEARAEWIHDYAQGALPTSGLLGGEAFTSTTPRVASDGARLGLAMTLNTQGDWSLRGEYEAELRNGYQSHAGLVKAILGF